MPKPRSTRRLGDAFRGQNRREPRELTHKWLDTVKIGPSLLCFGLFVFVANLLRDARIVCKQLNAPRAQDLVQKREYVVIWGRISSKGCILQARPSPTRPKVTRCLLDYPKYIFAGRGAAGGAVFCGGGGFARGGGICCLQGGDLSLKAE